MRAYAAAAAAGFGVLFVVPVALHLGFAWAEGFTGMAVMPDLGDLITSNALWAAAWALIVFLPLSYAFRRWAPAARSWAPVLVLAGVAFAAASLRLILSSGLPDLLPWAFAEAVLVVMGFLVFEAVATRR